ncbi:MAG: lipopolysaccharide heptosyltransferase II [Planctomycetes bacterium]|nr:lipopolysaccharide heptosyltransferase II [Planctomycetota bacterium]
MPLQQDINHLAILMPSWVGDVVMASCVWQMAREKYPNATITSVIRPNLAQLLEGVQGIDNVLPLEMKSSVFTASSTLKKIHADAIVLLPNSIRAAIIARLANIPHRVGYARDWRTWLLTEGVQVKKHQTPEPTTEYYLHLANVLFGMNNTCSIPSLEYTEKEESYLEEFSKPIVLLVAGASKEQKRWSPKNFAKVADSLAESGATCVGIGSPDEYELVEQIADAAHSRVHNLTRSGITLSSLATVVAQADLMITNDTGPRHLAVASGTPVITMYGPTDYRWTKYDCENDIAILADPFLPENLVADNNPDRCNINNIPSSDVIAIAQLILNNQNQP